MRADAHRNRARLVSAGNDVFMGHGPSAPLDWVATRAGVGNATLYRHFPTREKLIQEIVLDNVQRTEDLAATAVAEEKDPWRALVRFTTEAVVNRVVALLPVLWPFVASDDEFHQAIMVASDTVGHLLTAAQRHGDLRSDVATGDFILTLATVSLPLPSVPKQLSTTIRHRHIALLIDGMRASGASPLPAPSMSAQQVIDLLDAGDRL